MKKFTDSEINQAQKDTCHINSFIYAVFKKMKFIGTEKIGSHKRLRNNEMFSKNTKFQLDRRSKIKRYIIPHGTYS